MIDIKRTEVIDILDKMQFFQGQRAGRELWNDKPVEVQEIDLESFNRDIRTIRDYILQLEEKAKPVTDTNVGCKWIPIEWHETTDDDGIDKERYPFYLDCAMPDDAQEIIICRKNGWVCVDTCVYDDGYSLDSGADWIEDVIAWMPLPKAFEGE